MSEMKVLGLDDFEVNTPIDEIESESVNLIFTAIDGSGSMTGFSRDMQDSLSGFKDALENSKEADEILVARADFRNTDVSIGGYKKINEYDIQYTAGGTTPLYDVVVEGAERLLDYMDTLRKNGMRVKAVFSVFSDGEDNTSKNSIAEAIRAVERLNNAEVVTAFIAFGSEAANVGDRLQFRNKLNVSSSASELRKAFNCLSKSVIENSKSVVSRTDGFFI